MLLPLSIAAVLLMASCAGNGEVSSSTTTESGTSSSSSGASASEKGSTSESGSGSESEEVAVVSVSLSKSELTLEAGKSERVVATVTGSSNTNVTWSSADTTIATVTAGVIKGVKVGTTVITATSVADPTKKAEVSVTITEKVITKLSSITGPADEDTYYGVITAKTTEGFFIEDGTGALYVWKTLPDEYKIGDYVAVTATITAFWGLLETTSSVTIEKAEGTAPTLKAATALTKDIIDTVQGQCTDAAKSGGKTGFHLADMGPYTFTAKAVLSGNYTNFYLGDDTTSKYKLSPSKYSGDRFVNGVSYTVTGYYGGYNNSGNYYQFFVKDAKPAFDDVESITISGEDTVKVGASISLTSAVTPSTADPAVTWSSSDNETATVDSDGKVTGVKEGSVTITATSAANANIKAEKTITVAGTADKTAYVLATSVNDIKAGAKVVIANGASGAVKTLKNTIQKSYYLNCADDTVTDNSLADGFGGTVFTIETGETEGTFKFHDVTANNYLYAYQSNTYYTVINTSSSYATGGTMDWTVTKTNKDNAFNMKAGEVYLKYYVKSYNDGTKIPEFCGYMNASDLYFFVESQI